MVDVVNAVPTYGKPEGGILFEEQDGKVSATKGPIALYHAMFKSFIQSPAYPCVGAKAAMNRETYRFALYQSMATTNTTSQLHGDLVKYVKERHSMKAPYRSFIACFDNTFFSDEASFEDGLWNQLQMLHDLDSQEYSWDKTVSSDTGSPEFSFSIAETAFFIVGLHPASSRVARKFVIPTIVFNAHDQFETLRTQHIFDGMKANIRNRDVTLQGEINPNLVDFGEASEAIQYSGKQYTEGWKCPFNHKAKNHE